MLERTAIKTCPQVGVGDGIESLQAAYNYIVLNNNNDNDDNNNNNNNNNNDNDDDFCKALCPGSSGLNALCRHYQRHDDA